MLHRRYTQADIASASFVVDGQATKGAVAIHTKYYTQYLQPFLSNLYGTRYSPEISLRETKHVAPPQGVCSRYVMSKGG